MLFFKNSLFYYYYSVIMEKYEKLALVITKASHFL